MQLLSRIERGSACADQIAALVEIVEEDGKKVCHLTKQGKEELLVHEEHVERIWQRAHGWKDWGAHMGPESAEIWGSWGRLTKAAFRAAAKSDFEDTEKIRAILERARKELNEI